MALQWADFPSGQPGIYGGNGSEANMLNGTPWVALGNTANDHGLIEDPDPLVSGTVLETDTGSDNNPFDAAYTLALPTPAAEVWCAGRVWFNSFSQTQVAYPMSFHSPANNMGYIMCVTITGAIEIRRRATSSSATTTLATTGGPVVSTNAWYHLSFKCNFTTGAISVQKEGTEILSATDGAPLGGVAGLWKVTDRPATTAGSPPYLKDMCWGDTTGTQNNDHPGPVAVYDTRTDADVTLGGWTTSSGTTAWDLLDETPPNDADYVSANDTPPAPAECTLTSLDPDVTSVRAVMSIVRALKTDGGDGNLQINLTPDGVNYDNGADRPITTAATYWSDISEVSPATGLPWTPSEVNAARIQFDRTV